jgi:hypothetical protein
MGRLLVEHGVPTAWAFLRVNRSQITVDASLRYLQPDADYFRLGQQYFERARARKAKRAQGELLRGMQDAAQEAGAMVAEMPEFFFHQIEWFRRRARNFEVRASRAAFAAQVLGQVLVRTLALGAVAAGVEFWLEHREVGAWQVLKGDLPSLSPAGWALVMVVLFFWLRGIWQLRGRMRQQDVALIGQERG